MGGYLATLWTRYQNHRVDRLAGYHRLEAHSHYRHVWRELCEYVGLCHTVPTVSGPTIVTPKLVGVGIEGPDPVLLVEMLPGQLPAQYRAEAPRMVETLGCSHLRFIPRGDMLLEIELLHVDPLDVPVGLDLPGAGSGATLAVEHPVMLAQTETGEQLRHNWVTGPHVVVQGATGSGKSVWCYSQLAQLVGCDDVLICGSDPSGLLLGRPYAGTRHHPWQAIGTQDITAHLELLRRLVAEMDRRIAALPDRVDLLTPTVDTPLLLVVLKISFRVTDPEALVMLHPEARDWFADHAHAPAGVALLETPSRQITRVRGPRLSGDDLTDYATYWNQVQAATARLRPVAA